MRRYFRQRRVMSGTCLDSRVASTCGVASHPSVMCRSGAPSLTVRTLALRRYWSWMRWVATLTIKRGICCYPGPVRSTDGAVCSHASQADVVGRCRGSVRVGGCPGAEVEPHAGVGIWYRSERPRAGRTFHSGSYARCCSVLCCLRDCADPWCCLFRQVLLEFGLAQARVDALIGSGVVADTSRPRSKL